MPAHGTVERAYELARIGPCVNIEEIRIELQREQYQSINTLLNGPATQKHVAALCHNRLRTQERMTPLSVKQAIR